MKKYISLIILLIVMTAAYTTMGDSGVAYAQSTLPPGNWTLTWSDEFTGAAGSTPDPTKWYAYDGWQRAGENCWYTAANAYLDGNGNLVLKVGPKNSNGFYPIGFITTLSGSVLNPTVLFSQKYGYFEARIKGPARTHQGYWGAFWLNSTGMFTWVPGQTILNSGAEYDIVELSALTGAIDQAMYSDGYASSTQGLFNPLTFSGYNTGYHIYGFQWDASQVIWYVDGNQVWKQTGTYVSGVPQWIVLSVEGANLNSSWAGDISTAALPDYMYVDYVRVYRLAEAPPTPQGLHIVISN